MASTTVLCLGEVLRPSMRSAQGRSGPRAAWWEKCQDGGKVVKRKHIIYFSCGWESRLSYLVTLDALLTQQEEKKKRNRKDELMLEAEGDCSLVLWASRNSSFRGLSVLAPVVSPMG